jgi:hypothetical protein
MDVCVENQPKTIGGIMKKYRFIFLILVTALLFPFLNPVHSQKPEKVYSFVKVIKPLEWYLAQAELWKKEIDKDRKNADAWFNFYVANRMASKTDKEKWEKKKGPGFMDLDNIVNEMEKEVPESFEYNDAKVWNDGYQDDQNDKYLFKAYELAPDRPEVYSSLVNYYEMKRDKVKEQEICKKWYDSNDQSPNLLNYNYNVLMSLEDNGILITNGDNDTYPLWILQYVLGVKKNVMVVNIHLITVDSYRKRLYEENNIPADAFKALENPEQESIINYLITKSNRPVYFANTLSTGYYKNFEKDLYIVGLAFKYSKESFDNMAVTRNNYERKFLVDYLKVGFQNDFSETIMSSMDMGYLPFLIKLYDHYKLSGEGEKASVVKNLAAMIAMKGDPGTSIEEWFKGK